MKLIKNILVGLVAVVIVVIVMDGAYLWQNLRFQISPQTVVIPLPPVQAKMEPNRLLIPSLGISAPVQYVDQNSEKVFQEALINGVVHFPGTAKPGEFGNAYIFGHSSDYVFSKGNYKTVFALLPRIEINANIVISNPEGYQFIYKVINKVIVQPNETQYLDQYGYKKHLLTLQTSYPVGTALKRYIVIAELQ